MMTDGTDHKRQAMRTWGSGGFPAFGRHLLPAVARLVETVGISASDRVLDVACGHGSVALTAARRGASVVGVDLSRAMLDLGVEHATIAGGRVDWQVGDAERLPYADASFDAVLSNVGHVLAPDPEAAGAELMRVTAPGGRIGFTAWRSGSPLPDVFRALSGYLPTDPDAPPPFLWSEPAVVRERLGERVADLEIHGGTVGIPAVSVGDYWAFLVESSGPLQHTLEAIPTEDRAAAREDVLDALEPHFDAGTNEVRMGYRLVTATRR